MVEIRRVGVLSLALMLGLISAAYGLIFGVLAACVMTLGIAGMAATFEDLTGVGGGGLVIGLLYAVCLPILYFVFGFIGGAIAGLLYNFVAGIAGGIKIQLNDADVGKAP
jgi:hypothetical protein